MPGLEPTWEAIACDCALLVLVSGTSSATRATNGGSPTEDPAPWEAGNPVGVVPPAPDVIAFAATRPMVWVATAAGGWAWLAQPEPVENERNDEDAGIAFVAISAHPVAGVAAPAAGGRAWLAQPEPAEAERSGEDTTDAIACAVISAHPMAGVASAGGGWAWLAQPEPAETECRGEDNTTEVIVSSAMSTHAMAGVAPAVGGWTWLAQPEPEESELNRAGIGGLAECLHVELDLARKVENQSGRTVRPMSGSPSSFRSSLVPVGPSQMIAGTALVESRCSDSELALGCADHEAIALQLPKFPNLRGTA